MLTRLFMQFFMFEDKRPARYTTPNHAIAISYTWVAMQKDLVLLNHSEYLLELLTNRKKKDRISYLGAPEVLTRIAYQAIGMNHKLLAAPSQISQHRRRRSGSYTGRTIENKGFQKEATRGRRIRAF